MFAGRKVKVNPDTDTSHILMFRQILSDLTQTLQRKQGKFNLNQQVENSDSTSLRYIFQSCTVNKSKIRNTG